MCKDPGFVNGSEDEKFVVKNNRFPSDSVSLLNDPNEKSNASQSCKNSAKGITSRSGYHHPYVTIDGQVHIGRKGGQMSSLERFIRNLKCQDRAETKWKFTHDFDHSSNARRRVEYKDSGADCEDDEQKQTLTSKGTLVGKKENDNKPRIERNVNVRLEWHSRCCNAHDLVF